MTTIHDFAEKFPGQLSLGCSFRGAAQPLALKGWKVFPVKPRGKTPLTSHGLLDASSDPVQIEEWAERWPDANVGYATGENIVVDVDPRDGGNESLAALESKYGMLPDTLTSQTGGDGRHFFFRADGNVIHNSASKLGQGLDIRGVGGYVVVPHSVHESGKRYEWLRRIHPVGLPEWLRKMLVEISAAPATNGNGNAQAVSDEIPQGHRHQTMLSIAGALRARHLSPEGVLAQLRIANEQQCKPPLEDSELQKLAQYVGSKQPGFRGDRPTETSAEVQMQSFDDVVAESIDWLWRGRIPLGKLTIAAGDPGEGKSLVTNDVGARVSRGAPFPDGAPASAGDVIFLSAEDDAADTIRPRLDAAGADVRRVHRVKSVKVTLADGGTAEAFFNLERDLEKLEAAIAKIPDPRLLVIDPVNAYMGKIDTHRDSDVRRVLSPLADLASRRRIAVIGVMHLKKSDTSALLRVSGSIGFVAAARVVWGFGKDPDTPGNRIMVAVKNNLGPLGNGLAYRIVAENDVPRIAWQQGVDTHDANAVLGAERGEQNASGDRRGEAEKWLLALLTPGEEMPVSAIIAQAEAMHFSWRTIERAKKNCGVRAVQRRLGWVWVLA